MKTATLGILIRFSNSAETLPGVLAALKQQTLQPGLILGVDSGSRDASRDLIENAGGCIIEWEKRYEHSRVLNFGLRHLQTDLVLILSSHTVLEDPETLAGMVESFRDPQVACISCKWDNDPFYSDAIDWNELKSKGLKFGSIYSNSMGMIRRSLWQEIPFDETLPTAEDYAWAIEQLKRRFVCKRLSLPFSYRRSGSSRDREFARVTFGMACENGLKVAWLGVKQSVTDLVRGFLHNSADTAAIKSRLRAWVEWRLLLVLSRARGIA